MSAETTVEPLLLNAKEAAELCGISRSKLYELHAAGRVPCPVRLDRAVRWRRRELEDWIEAGCPSRAEWEARKQTPAGAGRGGY